MDRTAPLSDDELLALLQQVEAREALLREAVPQPAAAEDEDVPDREGDPCTFCGEPALGLVECGVCSLEGCLPRDDWYPGQADPCITRCARCGQYTHLACASPDAAGNPVCCAYRYSDAGWSGF